MKRALVISSQVASSTVGATASAFCLRRLGIQTVVLPTILFGRHPGWGAPGGAPVSSEILSDMWAGIEAQDLAFDAVLTGYMGNLENVSLAEKIIRTIKVKTPKSLVIVDPVMGDNGRLYVPVDVAENLQNRLIPHADIITPNVWEFCHLVKSDLSSISELTAALRDYGGCALVTSVENEGQIGGLSYHKDGLSYIGHRVFNQVPHGGGDSLAGALLAHILQGDSELTAAQKAISSIYQIMKYSTTEKTKELPLTACQDILLNAALLEVQNIT